MASIRPQEMEGAELTPRLDTVFPEMELERALGLCPEQGPSFPAGVVSYRLTRVLLPKAEEGQV